MGQDLVTPPDPPARHQVPVMRFGRAANDSSMLVDEGKEFWRLPPGEYVVYRAEDPGDALRDGDRHPDQHMRTTRRAEL